jgi:hypothetical protein
MGMKKKKTMRCEVNVGCVVGEAAWLISLVGCGINMRGCTFDEALLIAGVEALR